ncbi:MAG TPA: hypothetical protein VGC60_03205 [Pyrinomonadaceae bacterium]
MASNLPKIRLTEHQQLWLRTICSKLREGEQVRARTLKVELKDNLPKDFDPSEIDYRLLAGEDQITLLGIALLDPTSELVKKADLVVDSVHRLLIRNPEIKSVGAEFVSHETKLPKEEVAIIFRKLGRVGYFHDSGSIYGHGIDGLLTINIDTPTFDAYLKYESLNGILDTLVDDESALEDGTRTGKENLTHANQLYGKVKTLIQNKAGLDKNNARVIVESVDDALKEFGSTDQNKKIELREWRAKAVRALPPETFRELIDRGVKEWLPKLWPKNPKLQTGLLVIVFVTVVAGGLATFKRTFWDRPEPTPTPPLNSTNSNDGRTSKSSSAAAIPFQNAISTPTPLQGPDFSAATAVDGCFRSYFSGIPRDRQQHVESETKENSVVKRETQPKDGLLAITLFDSNQLVGGIKLTLFSSNYTPVFKDIALYNDKCQEIDTYRNKTLGGDKHVLNNWNEFSLLLNDHEYVLQLAYDENKANGYDTGKGAVIATFARLPENK